MALLLILAFFGTLLIGVPIAFCLGFTGLVGLWKIGVVTLQLVPQRMFTGLDLFPVAGHPVIHPRRRIDGRRGDHQETGGFLQPPGGPPAGRAGAYDDRGLHVPVGNLRGRSGGRRGPGFILIPSMEKEGYDTDFAAAVVASASVNGPIIPPSITMVVYACTVGVSVGGMFIAGFVPGVLLGGGLMVVVYILSKRYAFIQRKKRAGLWEIVRGSREAILALMMPVIILGGYPFGDFTATEAAGVAVFYALVVGILVYRQIDLGAAR